MYIEERGELFRMFKRLITFKDNINTSNEILNELYEFRKNNIIYHDSLLPYLNILETLKSAYRNS